MTDCYGRGEALSMQLRSGAASFSVMFFQEEVGLEDLTSTSERSRSLPLSFPAC